MKTIIMQNPVGKWWLIRWPSTEAQAQADLEAVMAAIAKEQES